MINNHFSINVMCPPLRVLPLAHTEKEKHSARIVRLWTRYEKARKKRRETREGFSRKRKAYAFRGDLTPRMTVNGLENKGRGKGKRVSRLRVAE
jgi:hypothetical protein